MNRLRVSYCITAITETGNSAKAELESLLDSLRQTDQTLLSMDLDRHLSALTIIVPAFADNPDRRSYALRTWLFLAVKLLARHASQARMTSGELDRVAAAREYNAAASPPTSTENMKDVLEEALSWHFNRTNIPKDER